MRPLAIDAGLLLGAILANLLGFGAWKLHCQVHERGPWVCSDDDGGCTADKPVTCEQLLQVGFGKNACKVRVRDFWRSLPAGVLHSDRVGDLCPAMCDQCQIGGTTGGTTGGSLGRIPQGDNKRIAFVFC